MAERQVRHMSRLLDDLLDVSRISRGRLELRKEPVDLVAARPPRRSRRSNPLIRERATLALPLPPESDR